ncbi:MAG: alpha/beta hydrolase, partial [Hyphomicrobium sp.]
GLAGIGYPAPEVVPIRHDLSGGAGLHFFEPAASERSAGTIVYIHGGGFTTGGIASHAGTAQALADVSGCRVAFVDYRLAPEHPSPAAIEDIVTAVDQVEDGPVLLLGDSAGGMLAFQACLRLRDAGISVAALLLVNPMLDPTAASQSYTDYAEGFFAPATDFRAGWAAFGTAGLSTGPLEGLPPTYIWTHEADPVRDDGEALARRLAEAGVPVIAQRSIGTVHASWLFAKAIVQAAMLLAAIAGVARIVLTNAEGAFDA